MMKKTTWITHDGKEWESEDAAKRWEDYCRRPAKPDCNDYLRRTGQCEPNLWAPESAAAVSPRAPKCEPATPPKLDLHQQIDLFRSQLNQALCERDQACREREEMRAKRNDLRTERDKLDQCVTSLTCERDRLQVKIQELVNGNKLAHREHDQMRAERDKLRALLSDVAHAMGPLLRRIGES